MDNTLNSSQKRHLLNSCQHADRLLSEIESILSASASRSPFPKYKPDILPEQAQVVRQYVVRMRAQMLHILESHGIEPLEPRFSSLHSVRVNLGYAITAFDACRTKNLRGYGEVAESTAPELNGMVNEIQGLITELDSHLARGA